MTTRTESLLPDFDCDKIIEQRRGMRQHFRHNAAVAITTAQVPAGSSFGFAVTSMWPIQKARRWALISKASELPSCRAPPVNLPAAANATYPHDGSPSCRHIIILKPEHRDAID
ncbi:hypothetical protein [Bradyrhizobium japonicum]|uniref:hypothetical protein n=1 Tax=Bradyrhizobium japonicum TaxID=375 RepID=UPI0004B2294D|nr:hypothetical protein [Bradyrhizobium japonicum]